MKKLLLIAISAVFALGAFAQGPNGSGSYYQNASGKKGAQLKTALFNIISKSAKDVGYDGLLSAYHTTDKRPDGYLRDWYSPSNKFEIGGPAENKSYKKEGDGYNREHLVPQSWFGSGKPKSDLIQVVPTDGFVNNRRGNYPFADVASATYTSKDGCKLGTCATPGYNSTVFEPLDNIKGDIARIYFYMATRYEDIVADWDGATASIVFAGNKYPAFNEWYLKLLFEWSKADPVDEVEIARNNAVYWGNDNKKDLQGNRNPFVDYPGLEEYIWGSKKDEVFIYDDYQGAQGGGIATVASPVISPDAGVYDDEVEIEISTSTAGASIYYTTDGTTPTSASTLYEGTFRLTASATVTAVAIKDGVSSWTSSATYTIRSSGGSEAPSNASIALNNAFFNTSYTGSINKDDSDDLVGTMDGVTVIYSLGRDGANRYCNDSQIRLYQNNTLTVSVGQGTITMIEFELANTSTKVLSASTGTMNGLVWVGDASSVVFSVNSGSGNMQIKNIKVTVSVPSGIHYHLSPVTQHPKTYNLKGQRVKRYGRGIYVKNGKKIIIH